MDLLERYLQAIGRSLPLATRQDTLAELRANLLAQLDAQQEQTGHPPTQLEIEALLRRHGHPTVVASRYFPQRSLIGPELFPFYVMTLRRFFPLVVFVSLIAYTAGLGLTPAQSPVRLFTFAAEASARLVPVLLTWWAIVTAIFGLIEYTKGRLWDGSLTGTWKPSSLPALDDTSNRKPLFHRIADFALHGVITLYLLATPFHPFLLLGPGAWYLSALSLTVSPSWHQVYTAFLGLLVTQLCLKALTLFGPYARWHQRVNLALKSAGLGIVIWVILLDFHVASTGSSVDPHVFVAINVGIQIACKLALIINLTDIAWSIWKFVQSPQAGRWQVV